MSSIVGHFLGGVIASKAIAQEVRREESFRFYSLMAIVAMLPDFDVVIFMLFHPAGMISHRGASHSLLFAFMSSVVLTLIFSRFFSFSRTRLFLCVLATYSSHLLLDYLMGCGPKILFFWPFIKDGYLSPVQLVPTAYYGLSLKSFQNIFISPITYVGIILELLIFLPWLYFFKATTKSRRIILLLLSMLGIFMTLIVYNRPSHKRHEQVFYVKK